jgi:hypothetical protein
MREGVSDSTGFECAFSDRWHAAPPSSGGQILDQQTMFSGRAEDHPLAYLEGHLGRYAKIRYHTNHEIRSDMGARSAVARNGVRLAELDLGEHSYSRNRQIKSL